MKKNIILGMACLVMLASCQKNNVVTLTGVVTGNVNQPIFIKDYKIIDQNDTLKIIGGKFQKTLSINTPVFKYFFYGNHRKALFLAPGYQLVVNFNAEKFDSTFRFEGKGAVENNILDSLNNNNGYNWRYIYSQPLEASLKLIDSTFHAHKSYLEKLVQLMKPDAAFKEYAGKMLDFEAASAKSIVGLQKKVRDSAYYSYLDSFNLEESKYLNMQVYRNLLQYSISIKTKKLTDIQDSYSRNSKDAYHGALLIVLDKIKDKEVKEYMTFSMIHDELRIVGVNNFEKLKAYFEKNVKDSIYNREFQKTYSLKLMLAPGKPAPEFTCADAYSNNVSLKDLRGKLVYIDFWATWCGPCRQEAPHYRKLQKEYKGKDITFVSISIDDDKSSWLKSLQDEKPEYISLIADKGWDSEVSKAYQIHGIPTFVLIDREGRIINCGAPVPSSPDVRKLLDEHLIKMEMKK
jgi:thiol-disulfide isomerase/thioredoxin